MEADDVVTLVRVVGERACRGEVGLRLSQQSVPEAGAAQVRATRRPSRSARATMVPRSDVMAGR